MLRIKCLIADDHLMFLDGLRRILENEPEFECVGMAKDGEEAVRLAQRFQPDIALLDASMPKLDGIDATKQIKSLCPHTSVVLLSAYKYPRYVLESIKAGADGYLLKHSPAQELVDAIKVVHGGKGVFTLEATQAVFSRLTSDYKVADVGSEKLQDRELEVLKLVAGGLSNKEVSEMLCISNNTVGTHLAHIYRKLGVQSRTEALLYALKEGILTVDDLYESKH